MTAVPRMTAVPGMTTASGVPLFSRGSHPPSPDAQRARTFALVTPGWMVRSGALSVVASTLLSAVALSPAAGAVRVVAARLGVGVGNRWLDTGQVQLHPAARGHGVGTRLVPTCLDFARAAGYRPITLWTNAVLTSAWRLYQVYGFQLVDQGRHHSFGPRPPRAELGR